MAVPESSSLKMGWGGPKVSMFEQVGGGGRSRGSLSEQV